MEEEISIENDALFEKISELFNICDEERKGYVTRSDLFRLKDELGLNDKDVEYAFDQLDTDRNNNLTLDEFIAGFGLFLGVEQTNNKTVNQIKADFAFQVFNLIDKHDKGHITRSDLLSVKDTLEISNEDAEQLFDNMKTLSGDGFVIRFEDFVNDVDDVIALSGPLQEIKRCQEEELLNNAEGNHDTSLSFMEGIEYDDDVKSILREQATELFHACDHDGKNYITKDDLLALIDEIALTEAQIISAFDKLDQDKNGFLTLDEFVSGFGLFLDIEAEETDEKTEEEHAKAKELFALCDSENKGYVTKHDLSRLTTDLGLSDDQVVEIFDRLDEDQNGFITAYEFTKGFSCFMVDDKNSFDDKYFTQSKRTYTSDCSFVNGLETEISTEPNSNPFETPTKQPHERYVLERNESETSERKFIRRQMSTRYEGGVVNMNEIMETIGTEVSSSITRDQLETLWQGVSSTDHMTIKMFEDFLGKVYSEIKSARQETKHLENVLEKKSQSHTREIKQIYDDMEQQMKMEKKRLVDQELSKEQQIRDELLYNLHEKDLQMQKMMQRQQALEIRMQEIKEKEGELKKQNLRLLEENVALEDRLNDSMSTLEETKSYVDHLQQQSVVEKKEALKAAVQATQGIQNEQESLLKQLEMLRNMNQKLRDDRDTIEASLKSKVTRLPSLGDEMNSAKGRGKLSRAGSQLGHYSIARKLSGSSAQGHSTLKKQGSVMSLYFQGMNTGHQHDPLPDDEKAHFQPIQRFKSISGSREQLRSIGESPEDKVSDRVDNNNERIACAEDKEVASHQLSKISEISPGSSTPSSPRHAPVGVEEEKDIHDTLVSHPSLTSTPSLATPENPNRVYKVVFVGDSGVGKSSFIHQFCFNDFRINFQATIGVDYQVKTIKVHRQWIALQLWDTAGQERFRSITKQYFRRADGVVIMFDLSNENSFTNVKGWMNSVEEGADPDCTLLLLGNKKDLADSSGYRRITSAQGQRVAKTYEALYSECSAKSGDGVFPAMEAFAKVLEQREDAELQKSVLNLKLDDDNKSIKKRCCGR